MGLIHMSLLDFLHNLTPATLDMDIRYSFEWPSAQILPKSCQYLFRWVFYLLASISTFFMCSVMGSLTSPLAGGHLLPEFLGEKGAF
jgi:hypothetical protein